MILNIELALLPSEAEDWATVEARTTAAISAKQRPLIKAIKLQRRTIDARSRQPLVRLWLDVYVNELPAPDTQIIDDIASAATIPNRPRVIIVGAGPAGYFAALELLEKGCIPIVLERGKDVQTRRRDLRAIQQDGIVNPHSNYCFGEGGAGTYSDGKLYTRSHKRGSIEKVLRLLVEHGSTPDILVDAHPHIGSNKLPKVVEALRQTILRFGGEVHFDTFVSDLIIQEGPTRKILGVVANQQEILADAVILATGHSARDIFELLLRRGVPIEAKPYALGVRIEHPQALIDEMQYHQTPREEALPAASYSLVCQVQERGVFSFCMCPGGLIVPAATSPNELVVNGMSMSRRDSPFANSGLVTAVELDDLARLGYKGELQGMHFQQAIEQQFFQAGDGSQKAPAQRITDFVKGRLSKDLPKTSYIPGIFAARLDQLLPNFVAQRLAAGLQQFGKQKRGYFTEEAQLIGVESRTSSPVRVPRDKDSLMHADLLGFFPCGEGAGYAGGIVSAAMDGQRVAQACALFLHN